MLRNTSNKNSMFNLRNFQRGFTLVELISVMVIVGIVAAVAMPKYFDRGSFDSRGFYDQVISTLRYAQKAAIAQHRFVCVTFPFSNSVTLTFGSNSLCASGTLASPTGTPYPLKSSQATFSPFPITSFSFDCLGRPRSVGNAAATCDPGNVVGVLLAAPSVAVSGYATLITVEQETGYVY